MTIVVFVLVASIFLVGYIWDNQRALIFNSLPFDFGSVSSLFVTFVIVLLFGMDTEIWCSSRLAIVGKSDSEVRKSSLGIVILALGIVGIIGIWLTVRTIGLFVHRYIIEVMVNSKPTFYPYFISDIFTMIGFILIANLCFTLLRTLRDVGNNANIGEKGDPMVLVQDLITTPIQAIIIGLVTIIPRYGDDLFLASVGGMNGYVTVVGVSLVSLVVLCGVWLYLRAKKS